jgi:MraZ protein
VLYAIEDWNRQIETIRKKVNSFNPEHNMFVRNYFMGTAELSLDNNNRILVPKKLMDSINADRDVTLAGQDGRIEIWTVEDYKKMAMKGEDLAKLGENLLGGNN